MRKIATITLALGLLAGVSAQSQAEGYSTKAAKHAVAQQRPLMLSATPISIESAPKFCNYVGGPHGTMWTCR
jgi:hypothetical protein